jgi:hypothetical protein
MTKPRGTVNKRRSVPRPCLHTRNPRRTAAPWPDASCTAALRKAGGKQRVARRMVLRWPAQPPPADARWLVTPCRSGGDAFSFQTGGVTPRPARRVRAASVASPAAGALARCLGGTSTPASGTGGAARKDRRSACVGAFGGIEERGGARGGAGRRRARGGGEGLGAWSGASAVPSTAGELLGCGSTARCHGCMCTRGSKRGIQSDGAGRGGLSATDCPRFGLRVGLQRHCSRDRHMRVLLCAVCARTITAPVPLLPCLPVCLSVRLTHTGLRRPASGGAAGKGGRLRRAGTTCIGTEMRCEQARIWLGRTRRCAICAPPGARAAEVCVRRPPLCGRRKLPDDARTEEGTQVDSEDAADSDPDVINLLSDGDSESEDEDTKREKAAKSNRASACRWRVSRIAFAGWLPTQGNAFPELPRRAVAVLHHCWGFVRVNRLLRVLGRVLPL